MKFIATTTSLAIIAAAVASPAAAFTDYLMSRFLPRSALPMAISDATATSLADGIFIFGGCVADQQYDSASGFYFCPDVTNASLKYYPATDSYANLASMPRKRYRHAAAALGSKIYLLGGRDLFDNIVEEIDVYDTSKDEWSTLQCKFAGATSDSAAETVGSTIVYVAGYDVAYTAIAKVWAFDGTCEGTVEHSELNEARGDVGITRNCDGKSLSVFGGFTHINGFEAPLATLETLSSLSSTAWEAQSTPANLGRGDKVFVELHCRQYVFGGEHPNHGGPVSSVEANDAGFWHQVGSMTAPRFRFFGGRYGDEVYLFGGQRPIQNGPYGTPGSHFPVTSIVEQYREVPRDVSASAATTNLANQLADLKESEAHAESLAKGALAIAVLATVVAALALATKSKRGAAARDNHPQVDIGDKSLHAI